MSCTIVLVSSLLLAAGPAAAGNPPMPRGLSGVPFTDVKLNDQFWAPRIETNRTQSLPHNVEQCRKTGRIDNFAKAGKLLKGKFEGRCYNDSDVYKLLEGASYSLAVHPDPALEKTVDEIIAKIAAAQQPDGYLNTYYTLAEPGKRLTNLQEKHELYCAGHLIEAAVAHFRATGKRTFLDVAVKYADFIDGVFGPTKRHGVPGHEEIELALVKLYRVTGQKKYFDLAKYFIDTRGDKTKRELWGEYHQDHIPIRQQSEIVGHAVRAMYLYAGTADVAAETGDRQLIDAMGRLWQDVTQRKMYVTGGIGALAEGEAFGNAYELPNESAYCETCAAIGLALWAHRLNLMHADAQYADVLERVIYNAILPGVSMDGQTYFYVNPLASDGKHHREPFFECACCPPNVARFLPSLPGYVYATGKNDVYVNLYIAGKARISLGDNTVTLTQETRYPWDGSVRIKVQPQKPAEFTINLRSPAWCHGARLEVAGKEASPNLSRGYMKLTRRWQPGDVIQLDMPMPVERIEAHPQVAADLGRVAVMRGPLVYCFEAADNGGDAKDIALAYDPRFAIDHRKDLLGGLTVVRGLAADGRQVTALPYYAWDHRAAGEMAIWVCQAGKSCCANSCCETWANGLYRLLDPASLWQSGCCSVAEQSDYCLSVRKQQRSIDRAARASRRMGCRGRR
jgi:uncharacterized protein